MKRNMFLTFAGYYLLFLILGFSVTYIFTDVLIEDFYVSREAKYLYTEATVLSNNYAADYYEENTTLSSLYKQLKAFSTYYDATIRIISTEGEIILDSSQALDTANTTVITNFDPTITAAKNYVVDTFFDTFNENTLSVISPITVTYNVRGYITMHKSVSTIMSDADRLINLIYFSCTMIAVCALLIWFFYYMHYAVVLKKMTKIAQCYAEGDFSKTMDITAHNELGYLAATCDYMATELNTLEDDQRKFISNISHDFRSPLTSIRGYVEAMKDGTIPPEMQGKYFDIILFETDRLTKLTGNLLDLNKFGQRGMMLDITTFDLNEIIKSTAATFEGTGRQKQITIDLVLTGKTMPVNADMSKIQQVLYNLIDNAMKFSYENSTIVIETTDRNEKVMVSVKDSGIGIPKASIGKVFDRFYKTDLSRGKDKKGSGLGLAIVKEIIQAHDENINVISTEGVGTEFIFSVSKAKEEGEI